jgi:hypothetical protein
MVLTTCLLSINPHNKTLSSVCLIGSMALNVDSCPQHTNIQYHCKLQGTWLQAKLPSRLERRLCDVCRNLYGVYVIQADGEVKRVCNLP